MSFLLDPPLLAGCGAASEALAGGNQRLITLARRVTVGGFVGVSLALYANARALYEHWPTLGARSGREFMLTSGLARVDERAITPRQHAAALSLFALYPLWFELGRRLVRR